MKEKMIIMKEKWRGEPFNPSGRGEKSRVAERFFDELRVPLP